MFMAGDERIMSPASLLMVHNAWTYGAGNAEELRKMADDIEKITQASIEAYKTVAAISEEKIKELMDNESWILPADAVEYGFATKIDAEEAQEGVAQQSALRSVIEKLTTPQAVLESTEVDADMIADAIAQRVSDRLSDFAEAAQELINTTAEMAEVTTAFLAAGEKTKNCAGANENQPNKNGWNEYFS